MQIDTSSKGSSAFSSDADISHLQDLTQEFLHQDEISKRVKGMVGKATRFNVNIDELRGFNAKLASYVLKHPIEAIKMFED